MLRMLATLGLAISMTGCSDLVKDYQRILNTESPIPEIGSVQAVYSNAAMWNTYVQADGNDRLSATNTPCDATRNGGYNSCIHGGELRRVTVSNLNTCDGVTAVDALDVFNWVCRVEGDSIALISAGLKRGNGLQNLIDFSTGSWRENSVTLTYNNETYQTDSAIWLTNPIVRDVGGTSAELTAANTVYAMTAVGSREINFQAHNVSLVTAPGVKLSGPGTGTDVINSGGRNFLWLEVEFQSFNETDAININGGSSFVRIHNSFIAGGSTNCIHFSDVGGGHNTTISNSYCSRGNLQASPLGYFLTIRNSTFFASRMRSEPEGIANTLVFNTVNSATDFAFSTGNTNNHDSRLLVNYTGTNFSAEGVLERFRNSVFHNSIVVNNAQSSFQIILGNNSFSDLLVQNLELGNAVGNTIAGRIFIAPGGNVCVDASGTPLIDAACNSQNGSGHTTSSLADISGYFVGKVSVDDSVNTFDSNGSGLFDSITDWTGFQNRYRGWGREGSAFPSADHRGPCAAAENCRIWDFRLSAANSTIREFHSQPTGDETLLFRWVAATETDCRFIPGASWNSGNSTCSTTFLRHAVEITNDLVGNENGLCESNEECIFSPNIGAYQGHGDLQDLGFITDGTLTNIRLYRYASNGI